MCDSTKLILGTTGSGLRFPENAVMDSNEQSPKRARTDTCSNAMNSLCSGRNQDEPQAVEANLNQAPKDEDADEAMEEETEHLQEAEKDKKIEELRRQLREYKERIEELETRARNLNSELERKNAKVEKELDDLRKKNNEYSQQVEKLQTDNAAYIELGRKQAEKICELMADKDTELQIAVNPKPEPSQSISDLTKSFFRTNNVPEKEVMYTKTRSQDKLFNADSEIIKKVKETLLSVNTELTERSELDTANVPCIVFCVFASRLAADVEDVFPDLKESPIILVILHPTRKEFLTDEIASHNNSLDSSIRERCRNGGIIHFVFNKDQGVYNCDQNNTSFQQFVNILGKFAKKFSRV